MSLRRLIHWIKPRTIRSHLIHMVLVLLLLQIAVSWLVITGPVTDMLKNEIGESALHAAKTIAQMPTVRRALLARDPHGTIQELAESIRISIGASYVVVGDRNGIRYSHPVRERIGQLFVGGDTGPALIEGKSYISEAVGSLGPSLRGMTPIFDYNDDIIGFVAVGYLSTKVQDAIPPHLNKPFTLIAAMAAVGILSALFIAQHLKNITLGLEPTEITNLYLERGAILEAIREGVVAVDPEGKIRLANKAAVLYAGLDPEAVRKDRNIDTVLPGAGLKRALASGEAEHDQERRINDKDMIFNIVPVFRQGTLHGVVASFRPKDELDRLATELSRVQEYSELLRVQTHEYSNKLHTIAGLIQIEAYSEALELVTRESHGYDDVIRFLNEAVPHPVIAAILLGKFNRAQELKLDFAIDRQSTLADVPAHIDQVKIVTILGNLLDNAFEAVLDRELHRRRVELSFTDLGNDIVFEIEDSGPGIPVERTQAVFEKGVSSKGKDRRGVGLYLVRQQLDELGGDVLISDSNLGGALFTVTVPKRPPGRNPEGTSDNSGEKDE
ncbi:sensor histidine kinase [Desulfovibrio mangrovi]|uniref:ATP-binding protein n=1 Tax=Desulfovibrio mangrovi TaxID=2976983 RepID=UPI0022486974|nr:sensor histidine kinase [Desulfovibrio mangrovi]UZP65813.1 sensor histidine kinase [Desulfovibrio mangrovi]